MSEVLKGEIALVTGASRGIGAGLRGGGADDARAQCGEFVGDGGADAAAAATKAILLQQQAMEKAVKEAATVAAVQAVNVVYSLS